MNDPKKTPKVAMTQLPSAPSIPLSMDTRDLVAGAHDAQQSIKQLDQLTQHPQSKQVGWFGATPNINSMLD